MTVKRLFPASIVDELTYCVEKTWSSLHLVYAWIFTLEGDVSAEVSRKALDGALSYFPKCKCILVNNYASCERWFRYRWQLTECTGTDILQEMQWSDSDGGIKKAVHYYMSNLSSLAIDPSSHIPLKVLLIRTPQRTFCCFIMHHAVADGAGSISFIQKFITCYEDIFYQRKSADHKGGRLEDISLPHIRFRWSHYSPRLLRPYLSYCSLFRKEPPVRLYARDVPVDSAAFVADVRDLPSRQLDTIRASAREHQATVNDYLLAALFRTVKMWTREWAGPSERIFITVPINLRSAGDRTMSNILSSVNVSLRPEVITDKADLLQLIRKEMDVLSTDDIARTTVNLSCLLKPLPLPLKRFLLKRSFPGFSPTLLLSNLAVLSPNPSHTDEEGFHYMGPARIRNIHVIPNAGAWPNVLVSTYNSQMAVTISVLSSCFSSEAAGEFMDCFLEAIQADR
jgi:NRPS condensation-like uncharacterized protein